MGNFSSQEDIEQWSKSTETVILTPETSEAGGSRDDESGNRTPRSSQREKLDRGFTPESYMGARHYGTVKRRLKELTQWAGANLKKSIGMAIMVLIAAHLMTRFTPNDANPKLPDLVSLWNETNPWPGKAYMIIEKTSGRAITLEHGELVLPALEHPGQVAPRTEYNTWLCCEQNNYWGFQNKATGRYMGHDGGDGMCVTAPRIKNWEMMVARPLATGGYLLLMPHYWHTLMMIAVTPNGRHLTRRMHGGAVWEFRMVEM